jgi:hypothetical protein
LAGNHVLADDHFWRETFFWRETKKKFPRMTIFALSLQVKETAEENEDESKDNDSGKNMK